MQGVIESFCQLFADDAKVFRNVCSSEGNKKLQCDIDKLSDWAEKWQLHFNTDKCKSLHIGRTNKRQVYQMNGISLVQVKEEKDLGVIIDHELKFHQQTAASVKKSESRSWNNKEIVLPSRRNDVTTSIQDTGSPAFGVCKHGMGAAF